MALDGILLHKIITDFRKDLPFKINKIHSVSQYEILFSLRNKKFILISAHPLYNRINYTHHHFSTMQDATHFTMVLRKHIEGALITQIEQSHYDRWCCFHCQSKNHLGDSITKYLYVELMGKYANIILVDDNFKIIDALKRIPPFENNKRTIQPGALFKPTPPQHKQDPFHQPVIDKNENLTAQLEGFSPLLSKEVMYRLAQGELFFNIMHQIQTSNLLYIAHNNHYHCIPLLHLGDCSCFPLQQGIDIAHQQAEEKERVKSIVGDIYKVVKQKKKHFIEKIDKINADLLTSLNSDQFRLYGDLLFTYHPTLHKNQTVVELENYEDNTLVTIPIDSQYTIQQNAQRYYHKYDKLKKAKGHLEKQLAITQQELAYFEAIESQLEDMNVTDAREILEELIQLQYIHPKKFKQKHKSKKKVPAVSYIVVEGIRIYFGKNNIQNEYLTFKLAKKDYTFFHVKDVHGAHVIVETNQLTETLIRTAANIAALFSKAKYSSSVPVDYTSVKHLKKIPGAKTGKVSMQTYQTIYIDPDSSLLQDFKIATIS